MRAHISREVRLCSPVASLMYLIRCRYVLEKSGPLLNDGVSGTNSPYYILNVTAPPKTNWSIGQIISVYQLSTSTNATISTTSSVVEITWVPVSLSLVRFGPLARSNPPAGSGLHSRRQGDARLPCRVRLGLYLDQRSEGGAGQAGPVPKGPERQPVLLGQLDAGSSADRLRPERLHLQRGSVRAVRARDRR